MHHDTPAPLFSVAGKTVLITGGSSGIGLMMAEAFVLAGARVYITGRHAATLEQVRTSLAVHGTIDIIVNDLAAPDGAKQLISKFAEQTSELHVLINNAGTTWGAPLESFPSKAWSPVWNLNVQAPFELVQAALPLLEATASAADPARVINIGSVYGQMTGVMQAYSYSASKAALHQLTRVLAHDLAPRHILVNAIAPGFFSSKMTRFVMRDETLFAATIAKIPLRRAGDTADVGGLAIMLSSRAGAYITGAIIPLDGGLLINDQ
jgi:NAD(P)-dependent dehydrogenase (short-subunit alcohol dehydrogenase family)